MLVLAISMSSMLLIGCADNNAAFQDPGTASVTINPGVISQKHFSIAPVDPYPPIIDTANNTFTPTEVEIVAQIGDRNNLTITAPHTINFRTEYGLINPGSCETDEKGQCSVTWLADKAPVPGGPFSDYRITITAYTLGEEAFTDSNGNSVFDDGDAGFEDLEEPYIDANRNGVYDAGDSIIDAASTNDPSGGNLVHDIGDGFFNGGGCTHTSLCATRTSIMIWDDTELHIDGPPAAVP